MRREIKYKPAIFFLFAVCNQVKERTMKAKIQELVASRPSLCHNIGIDHFSIGVHQPMYGVHHIIGQLNLEEIAESRPFCIIIAKGIDNVRLVDFYE